MSTYDSCLPAHWQFYAERAQQTQIGRVDDFGYGREELLSAILEEIQAMTQFTDLCCERLDRIPQNRAKKYRRLRQSLLGRRSLDENATHYSFSRPQGHKQSGEKNGQLIPEISSVTCRFCGQALIPAEHHIYGSKCENCWSAAMSDSQCYVSAQAGVDVADSVDQVRGLLLPEEWEVEYRLAAGETFADVARNHNVAPETLKVRASRWRARIRPTLAA